MISIRNPRTLDSSTMSQTCPSQSFSQKKIGSLRENKKLFSILQQFENASIDDLSSDSPSSVRGGSKSNPSATHSSRNASSRPHIKDIFNSTSVTKENGDPMDDSRLQSSWKTQKRHSEGEILESKTCMSDNKYKTLFKSSSIDGMLQDACAETSSGVLPLRSYQSCDLLKNTYVNQTKDNYNRLRFVSVSMPSSGCIDKTAKTKPLADAANRRPSVRRLSDVSGLKENIDGPPPIPRRGLSLPLTSLMDVTTKDSPTKGDLFSLPLTPTIPQNCIQQDSVKKAIQMYEGLSTNSSKFSRSRKSNTCNTVSSRKDATSPGHKPEKTVLRKNSSRKGSFKRKQASNPSKNQKESSSSFTTKDSNSFNHNNKEDSGIGFSDPEDSKTVQTIYQTLCSGSRDHCGTYDRLNRVHDMVSRIHKGQSSNCAACKATPSEHLRRSPQASPPLQTSLVKCNESSPHHHPPCICFTCQNSVFSCSQGEEIASGNLSNLNIIDDQENLYYNVCCFSAYNRDGWRQSRRRPVCELNGKLCIVNCDKERKARDNFYEHLSKCRSSAANDLKISHYSKTTSCDSCDSDEGWVDITDSDEEKTLSHHESCQSLHGYQSVDECSSSNTALPNESAEAEAVQNLLHCANDQPRNHSKISNDNISRCASSEHLYETIADLGTQNISNNLPCEEMNSLHENDPDSGEWSTESSSSLIGDTSPKYPKVTSKPSHDSSAQRFVVGSDVKQDTKKTFIKSVLGKKTVTPKKRRMSHFFVPWLVSNEEYIMSRSPKSTLKKQGFQTLKVDSPPSKAAKTFAKSKRSQSIPSTSSGATLSGYRMFSSSEMLDQCKSNFSESERDCSIQKSLGHSTDSLDVMSQRSSLASSTYLRPEQLHPVRKASKSTSSDTEGDKSSSLVSVEKVFSRSLSSESMHSYIVFQPIKEEDVPLYQFYERNIKERVSLCRSPECISPIASSVGVDNWISNDPMGPKSPPLKPQLSVVEQLSPDAKDVKMLWCELPEVKDSGILERISAQELKLQEAAFELIQSQASYVRSLRVLYEHFICAPEFSDTQSSFCVLSRHEHDVLFSDIVGVKEVSEKLLAELTTRWSDGILIPDICDIIHEHALMPSFSVYVKYCSNRVYQEKTLKELKETRLCFLEVLRKLESNPACQGLSLESFLFLPMQHIARLPLLLDSIFRWLSCESPSFNTCKMALEAVHKCFMQCNDGAKKMERLEEMFMLNRQLEFKDCKVIPLISASRWLLKRGELIKLEFDKKTFGKSNRYVRVPLHLFLFNNLLLVTKRKSDDCYFVIDYCPQAKVQAMAVEPKDLQQPDLVPTNCRYLIYLTLFSNHQGCAVDMILNCALLSERTRWIEAIHPVPEKKAAEVWEYDCPQVQCVRCYIAQQPDELSLQESDVVTIHRKMNDGWYEGRRLRDGLRGWFPASYTMDIPCSRARASNLRQCYRLLMLSQKHEAKQ